MMLTGLSGNVQLSNYQLSDMPLLKPRCLPENESPMAEEPPTSLAAYIKTSIQCDPASEFDLDLGDVLARFPDSTKAEFERALLRTAFDLRIDGRRLGDQKLLDQADALDKLIDAWLDRLGGG